MKLKPQLMLSISLLLFLAATGPEGHAVVPPPDGGYPGGNTAEGRDALLSLTTGTFNTAIGLLSLRSLTDGSFNTGIGAGTLFANVTSSNNTATGAGALIFHTAGNANTANGAFALVNDNSGQVNTAVGSSALFNNISGSFNTAVGSGFSRTGRAAVLPNLRVRLRGRVDDSLKHGPETATGFHSRNFAPHAANLRATSEWRRGGLMPGRPRSGELASARRPLGDAADKSWPPETHSVMNRGHPQHFGIRSTPRLSLRGRTS